jgi:hypothetical protein
LIYHIDGNDSTSSDQCDRAEWEGIHFVHRALGRCIDEFFFAGFTAVVNKELSAKYEILVDSAPKLIKALPWGPDFEVDVFRKPDFTALEVVSFATGGQWDLIHRCLDLAHDTL